MVFSKTHVYKVNRMTEVPQEDEGCIAWIRRNICERVPSVALVILAVLILILLLSAIPLAVFITYMAPQTPDIDVYQQTVSRFQDDSTWMMDDTNRGLVAMKTSLLKPPNVTSCVEHGFSCTKNPSIIISHNKRCDGQPDCPDESDEADCEHCLTSFSCPLRAGSNQKRCLRGFSICDGFADCADQSDELYFCHSQCEPDHYKCAKADRCIPNAYRCDGDEHCPGGDDEEQCGACQNGAVFCKTTNRCIPKWMQCDGYMHCPDASDELNCNCTACTSSKSALCELSGMCIDKSEVCNGIVNCPGGEDEEGCAGTCPLVPDVRHGEIVCRDGKTYGWKYACSGLYASCDGLCPACNSEMAINCTTDTCLHRSRVCDGIVDCPGGIDERACGPCDSGKKRCDGFPDCEDGHDERACTRCQGDAIHCRADNTCIPSHQRCDGTAQCSDAQDELNCACQECSVHPWPIYHCELGQRCFRKDDVCNPHTRCPKPTRLDKMYCATRNGRLPYF